MLATCVTASALKQFHVSNGAFDKRMLCTVQKAQNILFDQNITMNDQLQCDYMKSHPVILALAIFPMPASLIIRKNAMRIFWNSGLPELHAHTFAKITQLPLLIWEICAEGSTGYRHRKKRR